MAIMDLLRRFRCDAALRAAIASALLAVTPVEAAEDDKPERADEMVDVELVLAVDVSLSMADLELNIQRDGYAAALTDELVLDAILSGAYGKIAVTYVEWAGDTVQRVIVPWRTIASRGDADEFARALTANPPGSARRTSISGALEFASGLFEDSGYRGLKRVIDISGDGPNNQGGPVEQARDAVVAKGITINGLPLMTSGGLTSAFDVKDLDVYYENCVIGGPAAFMIPVNDWSQFPEAIRRKLVLELAGRDIAPRRAHEGLPIVLAQAKPAYDCLIGEKRWMDRSWMWESK